MTPTEQQLLEYIAGLRTALVTLITILEKDKRLTTAEFNKIFNTLPHM